MHGFHLDGFACEQVNLPARLLVPAPPGIDGIAAAGAIEAVFSLMTMKTGILPPTINYTLPDESIVLDVVPNIKRNREVTSVLSNSFGFGGQNACLVMTAEPGV